MKKKADIYLVQESMIWSTIQASCQNCIVQIFAQIGQFDWCEPYRIESQYEAFGSGFLIDEDGHIVTNAHVIENAKYIWIQIPALGRQKLEVLVMGISPDRDLALLKITDEGLMIIRKALQTIPFLLLGDSDQINSADNVLVLGYPLGQYHIKSTTGIISGREFLFNSSYLQITAPINLGSSGGPVINVQGHVVGIAVAIAEGAQSIGYAIPINELKIVLDDLRIKKFVRKSFLGVRFISAADEKAHFLHNPLPSGLYIAQVFPGGVCAQIGVQAGDMLYEFNGLLIDAYGETRISWLPYRVSIYDIISRIRVGDEINMIIYRKGKRHTFKFIMNDSMPFAIRRKFPDYDTIAYDTLAGMVVMELAENHLSLLLTDSPELVRFRQPENRINPVLIITTIMPGSYAYQVDLLTPGNIIRTLNGSSVATLEEWNSALVKSIKTGFVVIEIENDIVVVFSLEKILSQEEKLSKAFEYPLSDNIKKLQKMMRTQKK